MDKSSIVCMDRKHYVLERCYGVDCFSYVKGAASKSTLLRIVKKYADTSTFFRIITYRSVWDRDYYEPMKCACRVSYYKYGQEVKV